MRADAAAVVLFLSCSAALGEDKKPIDFSVDWWNYRCGHAILVEQGSILNGLYIPSSGSERSQKLSLTGFRSGIDLISFIVSFGSNGPITAWAGQLTVEEGIEKIITKWHMTVDVPDEEEEKELYKSIWAGTDVFVRAKPKHCS